nr:hypothetical protein [Tanacetum cinerariifolium]
MVLQTADPPFSQDPKSSNDDGSKPSSDDRKKVDEDPRNESECKDQKKEYNVNITNNINTVSSTINVAGTNEDNELPFNPNMSALEDVSIFNFLSDDEDDGTMADMNNLDTTIQVSPIPTIRIHKDHPLDQAIRDLQLATQTRKMSKDLEEHGFVSTIQQRTNHKDLQNYLFACFLSQEEPKKSAFLYGNIKEDMYVYQPLGFEDLDFSDRVYKVEKELYGLHQARRAWFIEVKTASTPMETQKPLLKDEDGEEVDVHMYRSMIGSLMYLTSSRPDIMFAVCACARYQFNLEVSHLYAVKRIFRDLQLADEEGIDFLPNSTIFEQLALMGKPKRKDTQVPQPSDPTDNVANEAVHKELGDRLVRATTIASSLEAKQDNGGGPRCQETIGDTTAQTRFKIQSKHSNDSLLIRGNTLQSDKDSIKLDELMALCTTLQNRVLDLEMKKTTQCNEIVSVKRRVKKLEKRNSSRNHKLKRLYTFGLSDRIESSRDEESLGEDTSKQERRIDAINADEDITLVNDADNEMFNVDNLGDEELKDLKLKEFDRIQEMFDRAFRRVNTFEDFRPELVEGKEKRTGEELEQEITRKQKVEDDREKAELK